MKTLQGQLLRPAFSKMAQAWSSLNSLIQRPVPGYKMVPGSIFINGVLPMVITTGKPISFFGHIYIYKSTFFNWFLGPTLLKVYGFSFRASSFLTTGLDIFLESFQGCLCVFHTCWVLMSFSYHAHNIIILCSYVCMSLYIYIHMYLCIYPIIQSFIHIIKSWYIYIYMFTHIYIYVLHILYHIYMYLECIYTSEIYTSNSHTSLPKGVLRPIRFDSCVLRWTNRSSKGRLYQAIVGSKN